VVVQLDEVSIGTKGPHPSRDAGLLLFCMRGVTPGGDTSFILSASPIQIFDTTLRDGEQTPGVHFDPAEKLQIARMLARLGVDVIEAGFPAASVRDAAAAAAIAKELRGVRVAALARCHAGDISAAWAALAGSDAPRLHVFLATSPLHREHKLGMSKLQVLETVKRGVAFAVERCSDVEFSPEDGMRTEPDFLLEVVQAAIEAGANVINLPDTVGYALPFEMAERIRQIRSEVPGIEAVTLSVHCHDDLGLAVANSLAAIEAGARQVECTLNGLGERAGNAALEEIVMALHVRRDVWGDRMPGVITQLLAPASDLVSHIAGIAVPPNKAVVGGNAFAHESGIHQHGVIQHAQTYEIIRPEDVGRPSNKLVLGKHSGRHALRQRLSELGWSLDETQFESVATEFKALADRKREIHDADLRVLVLGNRPEPVSGWELAWLQSSAGRGVLPSASVRLTGPDGQCVEEAATGDGPVDASFRAVRRAVGLDLQLLDYSVRSVGEGQDAQGQVVAELALNGVRRRGFGLSTDVIEASALAFVDAINRMKIAQSEVPA
jgi:2-isopropylmalate synthase